jgi:hypothetical protein
MYQRIKNNNKKKVDTPPQPYVMENINDTENSQPTEGVPDRKISSDTNATAVAGSSSSKKKRTRYMRNNKNK